MDASLSELLIEATVQRQPQNFGDWFTSYLFILFIYSFIHLFIYLLGFTGQSLHEGR